MEEKKSCKLKDDTEDTSISIEDLITIKHKDNVLLMQHIDQPIQSIL
jgi:hypothetical protein